MDKTLRGVATLIWILALAAGEWSFFQYQRTPGITARPTAATYALASHSQIRPTLLLFAHPLCPCTRASLEALATLQATLAPETVTVDVVFVQASGLPATARTSPLWRQARAIPGVTVIQDEDGTLARRCGAETSGQVLVYGADTRLLFAGGITPSRGETGDCPGIAAVTTALHGGTPPFQRTAVFGCALLNDQNPKEAGRGTWRS